MYTPGGSSPKASVRRKQRDSENIEREEKLGRNRHRVGNKILDDDHIFLVLNYDLGTANLYSEHDPTACRSEDARNKHRLPWAVLAVVVRPRRAVPPAESREKGFEGREGTALWLSLCVLSLCKPSAQRSRSIRFPSTDSTAQNRSTVILGSAQRHHSSTRPRSERRVVLELGRG